MPFNTELTRRLGIKSAFPGSQFSITRLTLSYSPRCPRWHAMGRSRSSRLSRLQRRWSRHPHRPNPALPFRPDFRDRKDPLPNLPTIRREHHTPPRSRTA